MELRVRLVKRLNDDGLHARVAHRATWKMRMARGGKMTLMRFRTLDVFL